MNDKAKLFVFVVLFVKTYTKGIIKKTPMCTIETRDGYMTCDSMTEARRKLVEEMKDLLPGFKMRSIICREVTEEMWEAR